MNMVTGIKLLYKNLLDLERNEKVIINLNLQDQLKIESTKHRNINKEHIFTQNERSCKTTLKS